MTSSLEGKERESSPVKHTHTHTHTHTREREKQRKRGYFQNLSLRMKITNNVFLFLGHIRTWDRPREIITEKAELKKSSSDLI